MLKYLLLMHSHNTFQHIMLKFMFLKNNLGIVSLAYVSHAGCQQTAEQMCFAMYHLDHLVSDIPLRKS